MTVVLCKVEKLYDTGTLLLYTVKAAWSLIL